MNRYRIEHLMAIFTSASEKDVASLSTPSPEELKKSYDVITLGMKNHLQRYDVMLWKYEYETDQNNMTPPSTVFTGLKETTLKI